MSQTLALEQPRMYLVAIFPCPWSENKLSQSRSEKTRVQDVCVLPDVTKDFVVQRAHIPFCCSCSSPAHHEIQDLGHDGAC